MTAAYRLKGLGWLGGVTILSLAFYLVSLQVAAERKKLEQENARIGTAERDIRALETEFDTRSNLAQLERWNGDTLALAAPTAGQFVRDEAQLASISFAGGAGGAAVRTAALVVPSLSGPVTVVAAQPVETAAQDVAPAIAAPPPVLTARTMLTPQPVSTKVAAHEGLATLRPAVAMRARPEMALLDRKLLSDTTLVDLMSGARSEGRSH